MSFKVRKAGLNPGFATCQFYGPDLIDMLTGPQFFTYGIKILLSRWTWRLVHIYIIEKLLIFKNKKKNKQTVPLSSVGAGSLMKLR